MHGQRISSFGAGELDQTGSVLENWGDGCLAKSKAVCKMPRQFGQVKNVECLIQERLAFGAVDNRSGSYHVLAFHDRMKARVGNGGWCSGSASAVVAEAVVPLHTSRSANRIRAQIAFVFR